jgi:toxin YoeB
MSTYTLRFSEQAIADIRLHKKAGNKAIIRKITTLLEELTIHPFTGTGKPEQLKYQLAGLWSRRINHEHRLIYEVQDDIIVIVLAAKGHYE